MIARLIVLAALGGIAALSSFVSMDVAAWPLIALAVGTFAAGWIANYLLITFG